MAKRTRLLSLTASLLATATLLVGAVSCLAPAMHWLHRHPGAVTLLRLSPLLSLVALACVNYRRARQR